MTAPRAKKTIDLVPAHVTFGWVLQPSNSMKLRIQTQQVCAVKWAYQNDKLPSVAYRERRLKDSH